MPPRVSEKRSCRRIATSAVVVALLVPVGTVAGAAAATKPRVESVAVAAVAHLGDTAPLVILAALQEGTPLRRIVRQLQHDKLRGPVLDATGTVPAAGTALGGIPAADGVVRVTERSITPGTTRAVAGATVVVVNDGDRPHQVRVVGASLPDYYLTPGTVGVYALDDLDPGTYTIATVGGGRHLTARLVVRGASNTIRAATGGSGDAPRAERARLPSQAEIAELLAALREAPLGPLTLTGLGAAEAKAARQEIDQTETPIADPAVLAKDAQHADVDVPTAALTQAILLAARAGYAPGQIGDAIRNVLATTSRPRTGSTGDVQEHLERFWLAGVIEAVDPAGEPVRGIFATG
jgi:hypothetical protein